MVAGLAMLALSQPARAQETAGTEPQPKPNHTADVVKFLAGAAVGLVAHESGHLVLDFAFDAKPYLKRVELGGVPFFAITHRSDLSPRREYAVSSAGFWVQETWNEILLTKQPMLRHTHAPFAKGALAFNILTSIGYAAVAFAKTGPAERDTRGWLMPCVDERAIAAMVLSRLRCSTGIAISDRTPRGRNGPRGPRKLLPPCWSGRAPIRVASPDRRGRTSSCLRRPPCRPPVRLPSTAPFDFAAGAPSLQSRRRHRRERAGGSARV